MGSLEKDKVVQAFKQVKRYIDNTQTETVAKVNEIESKVDAVSIPYISTEVNPSTNSFTDGSTYSFLRVIPSGVNNIAGVDPTLTSLILFERESDRDPLPPHKSDLVPDETKEYKIRATGEVLKALPNLNTEIGFSAEELDDKARYLIVIAGGHVTNCVKLSLIRSVEYTFVESENIANRSVAGDSDRIVSIYVNGIAQDKNYFDTNPGETYVVKIDYLDYLDDIDLTTISRVLPSPSTRKLMTRLDLSRIDPRTFSGVQNLGSEASFCEVIYPKTAYDARTIAMHFGLSHLKNFDLSYAALGFTSRIILPAIAESVSIDRVPQAIEEPSGALPVWEYSYSGNSDFSNDSLRAIGNSLNKAGYSLKKLLSRNLLQAGSVRAPWYVAYPDLSTFSLCAGLQFAHIAVLSKHSTSLFSRCPNLRELILSAQGDGAFMFTNTLANNDEPLTLDKLVINSYVAMDLFFAGLDTSYPTTVYYRSDLELNFELPEAWAAVPYNDLSEILFQYAPTGE